MLNQKKVELMTRIIHYEQGEGKEPLKLEKMFNNSQARSVLHNIPYGAAAYLLLMAILYCAFGYKLIDFGGHLLRSIVICAGAFAVGAAFVLIYAMINAEIMRDKYDDVRPGIGRYSLNKRKLNKLTRELKTVDTAAEK